MDKYSDLPNQNALEVELDSRKDLNEDDYKRVLSVVKELQKDENAILFRAGGPLNHSIRGRWHNLISSRGGIVITQDEEGINKVPLLFSGDKSTKITITRPIRI